IRLSVIWKPLFGDLKFGESSLIITVAIVVRISEREMALGQIRLQSQRFVRVETRFVAPARGRVCAVIYPALRPRKTCKRQSKVRIEFDRLFEKWHRLQRRLMKDVHLSRVIVRLNIEQISLRILCRLPSQPFLFIRG